MTLENPKRLAPTPDTIRELYLKSGNECAFPGCDHRIVNQEGVFIAQLCHIEAALPGGPRFNPHQTNEERREFGNLMLMCHAHHKVTDDVVQYSAVRLRQIKRDHEARFTDVIEHIRNSIVDYTAAATLSGPHTLARMNDVLDWGNSEEEARESGKELAEFAERLKRVPQRTRQLLHIVVDRGSSPEWGHNFGALHDDIVEATHLSDAEVVKHVRILENHGLGSGDYYEETSYIHLSDLESGWRIWDDLKAFAERTGIPLQSIIVDLRFDLLDGD